MLMPRADSKTVFQTMGNSETLEYDFIQNFYKISNYLKSVKQDILKYLSFNLTEMIQGMLRFL